MDPQKEFPEKQQGEQVYLPKEPPELPREPEELPASSSARQTQTPNQNMQDENQGYQHGVKTLLSWHAPGRPFRKRRREFYLSSLLIMLFIEIILFLFSQYVLMLVVLSLVFVSFALVTIPPHLFHYRISSEGIMVEDHFFLWQELYDFYFKTRDNLEVLHIRTHTLIPGELTIILGDIPKEHVKSILLPYLPYREYIKPTFMEKAGDWLSRNFPLEKNT
ncbi:hypothetical protein M1615_00575 [Patescibacteria group bacterium]|nr:hypothetical protein [Patescibacteria group bacterium]MCL5010220.1 hypothetical protein [Patescibacteria group bacterium]